MSRSSRSTSRAAWLLAGAAALFVTVPVSAGNDSSGITMLANMPFSSLPGDNVEANDIYGYTSPSGREYGLFSMRKGVAFVEITNPASPVVVDYVSNDDSLWGDLCTHESYAYKVNETANGIQVIDLTNIDSGSVTLLGENHDGPQNDSHNIQANNESGYIYTLGSDNFGGGVMAFNVSNPANPVFEGGWDGNYCHDAYFCNYDSGPYAGREFGFIAGGSGGVFIVDVTDKTNMFTVSSIFYDNVAYTHQLWLDEDKKYLYVNDELDEISGSVATTTTYVFDVSDLANPTFVHTFTNGITATDHNMWGRGGFLFQANYESGLRVYDIRDQNNITEVAYYDTYAPSTEIGFAGAWGVFTDFASELVIVSDRVSGFWIFDTSATTAVPEASGSAQLRLDSAPNPFTKVTSLSFVLEEASTARLAVFDANGRQVDSLLKGEFLSAGSHRVDWNPVDIQNGVYFAVLNAGSQSRTSRIVLSR